MSPFILLVLFILLALNTGVFWLLVLAVNALGGEIQAPIWVLAIFGLLATFVFPIFKINSKSRV